MSMTPDRVGRYKGLRSAILDDASAIGRLCRGAGLCRGAALAFGRLRPNAGGRERRGERVGVRRTEAEAQSSPPALRVREPPRPLPYLARQCPHRLNAGVEALALAEPLVLRAVAREHGGFLRQQIPDVH